MDTRWSPFPKDSSRTVAVIRHPTATFVDILYGSATDSIDLTQYASTIKHTSKDADVKFVYHTQLNTTNQPQPGELLELQLNGQTLWVGIIDSITAYTMTPGEHSLTVKAYSRENTPTWKSIKRVTNLYTSGTPVDQIATDIADAVGLTAAEIAIPSTSVYIVHSNMQLANMAAWEMLGAVLLSSGYDPFVDARGVLKGISRSFTRNADVILDETQVVAITGSKKISPVTSVRVLWLDPALSEVLHQDQALAQANITAGFFQDHQYLDVYFSADETQRAQGTYMNIKQSANSGLIPFCTEKYVQFSPTNGQIQIDTSVFAPLLATTSLAIILADALIADGVITVGFIAGTGATVPYGRVIQAAAEITVLLTMMSLGTGMYEIRGLPYDLVNARNRTEATAKGVPAWLLQSQDISSDFVMNEAHAQAFAIRELLYQSRAATNYNARILDDPRIEPGDIVQLFDGSRIYVTDYQRTLTFGTSAVLDLVGFQANIPSATTAVIVETLDATGAMVPTSPTTGLPGYGTATPPVLPPPPVFGSGGGGGSGGSSVPAIAVLVQSATQRGIDASLGVSVSLPGVTAGNFLTLQISVGDNSSPPLPTDSIGTWTSALPSSTPAEGVGTANVLVCFQSDAAAGLHTANCAIGVGGTGLGYMATMCEWSGMGSTSSVDTDHPDAFTDDVPSVTVAARTLVQANELVLGTFVLHDSTGRLKAGITNPPSGFSPLAVQNDTRPVNGYIGAEHCYIANIGSTALPTTEWSSANSANGVYLVGSVVTFKVAAPSTPPAVTAPISGAKYHGVNLQYFDYFNTDFPFVNVIKQAGSNDDIPWVTAPNANNTGDIQLDSSGYPTSMLGVSGQTFTSLKTLIFVNLPTAPAQSSYFPPGPWRFEFTGKGTLVFSGAFDAITSISNTGAGTSTYSGTAGNLTVVSPTTGVTTVDITSHDSAGGLELAITAIPDSANNPRNWSLVQQSKAAAYDGGQIFSDYFLAMLKNFSSIRTKDWTLTDTEMTPIQFDVQLNAGATSATMKEYNYSTNVWQDAPWTRHTGSYLVTWTNGQQITCGLTWNSPTITFPALTSNILFDGTTYHAQAWCSKKQSWATRPKYTDFSFTTGQGVPYEVGWALANTLNAGAGIDCMFSAPAGVGTPTGIDLTYVDGLAHLAYDGTGTTLPGFAGLFKKAYVEWSNEIWNTSSPYSNQNGYAIALGNILCPGSADAAQAEYRGAMTALIADEFYSIYGSAFAARVQPSFGGQTAWSAADGSGSWGIYYTVKGMDSPHWSSAAYTHHIESLHFAPYVGMNPSAADKVKIFATASPLDCVFGLAYTNVYKGVTFTSVDPLGWVGGVVAEMVGLIAGLAGNPWSALPIICYESGSDFAPNTTDAWASLCIQIHYDPRMEFIYHDSGNVLYTTYGYTAANGKLGYLDEMVASGITFMHQLTDTSVPSKYGEFGAIESVMQNLSTFTTMPAKYRAIQKFMQGY